MSREHLDGNDKKVLLIWILAGLLGAGVAYKYFFQAFPEASVEFKVTRAAALEQARLFASAQGAQLDGYQSSIIFDVDETAKTYLEREVGLKQANQMMKSDVHIWYWEARFFRPLQKEEFDVRVDPAGGVVGYTHTQEEAAAGARLERAVAQAVAESFLRDTLHADLSRYDFREEEANLTERPNRRDWSFSWEQRGFRAKDAPYRLSVTLAGDRVDGYEEFLKVPEAWKLNYQRLRSSNNLIEYIALIPYAFLLGGCLFIIFLLGRRGLLEWRGSLALGVFLTVLYFIMTMNQWPLDRAGYDTNTPYSSFFLSQAGQAALISIISALLVVLAVAPGEPLYRVLQPGKIRLDVGFRLPGIRTKEFFSANVIGICLAATHIGYITVFYVVSRKLGAWAPQDLNYTNVVSTSLPWVYPLAIGIYAATSEEFLFRLFAIPFLLRTTKSKFLAVVLPAFAWGFLHSNYPQEPAYIRGIEVGLIGIVAGLVMLRWGIWATLIWHYTVDAFLISTSLLRSEGAYLRISGAIVGGAALIPLAIAGISYLSRGRFETDAALLNSAHPLSLLRVDAASRATQEAAPEMRPGYTAMSSRTLAVLVACGVLGAALLAGVKREAIGDFVRFQIHAREATARADQVLRDNKLDPASYQHATTITYTFDGYANEYLRRTIGIAAANRVYRDQVPSAFWTVRYFRDSQNEEYMAVLQPDGSLHSLHHTLDEKAPGANLTKEEALARAEAYLRDQKKLDLSSWNLVESDTDKHPARTDHTFVWEQKAALDPAAGSPGAHVRMQVQVQGDKVSGYRVFIKIPEVWRDSESRTTAAQILQTFGRALLVGVALITVLVISLRSLKHPEIAQVPWRRLGKWSAWVLLAAIVVFGNRAPQLLANYTTTWPLKTFYAILFISLLFITAVYLAAALLLLGLSWFFGERAFGRGRIPAWTGMRSEYYRDASCVALFGAAAVLGFERLPGLFARWPLLRHTLGSAVPDGLDTLNPAAGTIASAISGSFFVAGLVALSAALIAAYVRPLWMRAGLSVFVAVLMATNVATPGAFLRDAAFHLLTIAVLWLGVTRVVRFNVMGYFLLASMIVLAPGAIELLKQPNAYFRANGYAVAAFALVLLAWPLLLWRRGTVKNTA
ncbi:MAG: CPBP family intramembrane metalloprotease [Acidobacteriia bacterium]|nr:CPBP family intramembrane metalloprotease [Terriglobia bacterium]